MHSTVSTYSAFKVDAAFNFEFHQHGTKTGDTQPVSNFSRPTSLRPTMTSLDTTSSISLPDLSRPSSLASSSGPSTPKQDVAPAFLAGPFMIPGNPQPNYEGDATPVWVAEPMPAKPDARLSVWSTVSSHTTASSSILPQTPKIDPRFSVWSTVSSRTNGSNTSRPKSACPVHGLKSLKLQNLPPQLPAPTISLPQIPLLNSPSPKTPQPQPTSAVSQSDAVSTPNIKSRRFSWMDDAGESGGIDLGSTTDDTQNQTKGARPSAPTSSLSRPNTTEIRPTTMVAARPSTTTVKTGRESIRQRPVTVGSDIRPKKINPTCPVHGSRPSSRAPSTVPTAGPPVDAQISVQRPMTVGSDMRPKKVSPTCPIHGSRPSSRAPSMGATTGVSRPSSSRIAKPPVLDLSMLMEKGVTQFTRTETPTTAQFPTSESRPSSPRVQAKLIDVKSPAAKSLNRVDSTSSSVSKVMGIDTSSKLVSSTSSKPTDLAPSPTVQKAFATEPWVSSPLSKPAIPARASSRPSSSCTSPLSRPSIPVRGSSRPSSSSGLTDSPGLDLTLAFEKLLNRSNSQSSNKSSTSTVSKRPCPVHRPFPVRRSSLASSILSVKLDESALAPHTSKDMAFEDPRTPPPTKPSFTRFTNEMSQRQEALKGENAPVPTSPVHGFLNQDPFGKFELTDPSRPKTAGELDNSSALPAKTQAAPSIKSTRSTRSIKNGFSRVMRRLTLSRRRTDIV